MIVKFNEGDMVRDAQGSLARVTSITVLYTLDNGKTWNQDGIEMVEKTNREKWLLDNLCNAIETNINDMTKRCRKRPVILKRQGIIYILRNRYGWTYQHIGDIFKRDHATMISATKHFGDLLTIKDKDAMKIYNTLLMI